MKPIKLFALILAVCLLSCAFVACDSGDSGTETEAATGDATEAATKVTFQNVNLVIQKDGKDQYTLNFPYSGDDDTLASVIKFYCRVEFETDEGCFDNTGLLSKIGDIQGTWTAYDKDKGSTAGAIGSIASHQVTEGATIVLNCSTK